jgi:Cof subfamily protein (haloacid dehalogenase superfamily)
MIPGMETAAASIRMLVIDIDGTLLTPEGTITAPTLAAVQAAQQAGIVVTLATARRYYNTVKIANELCLDPPLILYDGAMIVQHPDKTILYMHPLRAEVGQQAVELLVRHKLQPVVHPATGIQELVWTGPADFDNPWVDAYFTSIPEQVRRMSVETLCIGHPDPIRVVAFAPEEIIQTLLPEVSELDCAWTITRRGNFGSAELAIMNPTCSKASGVAELAQFLTIPLEQIMAIGDNNNDIEMLRNVGWGVAMGQASEAVKSAARAVTASNWDDGVALAIERYALRSATTADSNSLNRLTCL